MTRPVTFILMTIVLMVCALSGTAHSETVVFSERSLYRNIIVSENKDTRCLRFSLQNNTLQSCFSLRNPDTMLFECNKMMLGSLYLNPNPRRILTIGLGGGTLASALARILPNSEIDVVEIDPAIVKVAKEYFNFKPSSKVRVIVEDGRVYVKRAIERGVKYDLIILDAFGEVYIPTHLLTRDFFGEVKKILTPEGVLAANTYSVGGRYDNESVTYQSVFGKFFNLKKFWTNVRVVIAKMDGLPAQDELEHNAKFLEKRLEVFDIESSWLLPLFSTKRDWDEDARVLTDKFLPF